MISPAALDEFKTIILEDYGVSLDDVEATRLASDYLVALEAILMPPRKRLTRIGEEAHNGAKRSLQDEHAGVS